MNNLIIRMKEVEDTQKFAEYIGKHIENDVFIALTGELGAGKTAFVQGLAKGMGIDGPITSPTFTIMNYYDSKIPLKHFDFYRLETEEDLYQIGWEEYGSDGVVVVEWADMFPRLLPPESIYITIEKEEGNTRKFHISWNDNAPQKIIKEITDYATCH